MWPRELFDIKDKKGGLIIVGLKDLHQPGVYILYRDDHPYYVGRATKLLSRLHAHANMSGDTYFNFWNYFSVFVVPDRKHLSEVEGILIASMPTANRSVPKVARMKLPNKLVKILKKRRTIFV